MDDSTPDPLTPLSLNELHELRRKILHDNYEPDILEMKAAVAAICIARPAPEEKAPKASRKKREVVKVNLDDLLSQ